MKFIQVFNRYLEPGGEETSVARIARHLESGGHEVARFWRSSHEWDGVHAPARFRQPFLMWKNQTVLQELLQFHIQEKPKAWILHNILPVISLGVYRLARKLNVPLIQWLHNYRPISPSGSLKAGNTYLQPDDRWIRWKESLAGSWRGRHMTGWLSLAYAAIEMRGDFSSVSAWITVSSEMRAKFLQAGWPSARLFTLRHAWDIHDGISSRFDEGYFLFLGRMIEIKGVEFLVALWRDCLPEHLHLVMAGEGPLRDSLSKASSGNIRWVGYVDGEQKRDLIAGCRAIVFPSLWPEPLSTIVYEAFQMGKPVLSSDIGGMKELVTDGQTGRLLKAADHAAWRDAILQLAGDSDLAYQWGATGRQWLERNVSPAVWNEQFNAILRHVLGE